MGLSPLNMGESYMARSVGGPGSGTRTYPGYMTGFLEPIPHGGYFDTGGRGLILPQLIIPDLLSPDGRPYLL